jgi:hypothetical protein
VIVVHDLDHRDVGLLITVGQRAGLVIAQGHGCVAAGIAIPAEAVEGVTRQQSLAGFVGAGVDGDLRAAGGGVAGQRQFEVIGRRCATVIVVHDLDHRDVGCLIVVGDGAGLVLTCRQ